MKEKFSRSEKIILIILGTLFGFTPLSDPDFGWHYKYGEYFVKHGQILRENIFSYTMPDYKWANSYWISEVFFYLAVTFLGVFLLNIILGAILTWTEILLTEKIDAGKTVKFFALIILWTTLDTYAINIRPLYFSTLFFILIIYALLYKPKLIRFSPLLFLLWVNMHADFVLGLAVIGIYLFFHSANLIRSKTQNPIKNILINLCIFIGCFAVTFLNPFGAYLWKTLFNDIFNPTQTATIGEWLSVLHVEKFSLRDILNAVPNLVLMTYLALPIIFSSVQIVARKVRKKYLPSRLSNSLNFPPVQNTKTENYLWLTAVNILFLALTFRSIYFLRILFITSLTQTVVFWDEIQKRFLSFLTTIKPVHLKIVKILSIIVIIIAAVGGFIRLFPFTASYDKLSRKIFCSPKAFEYIKNSKLQGRMFNSFDLGGFLIWRLPEIKVFIDGRMNSWKDSSGRIFDDYMKIDKHPKENYGLFKEYADRYDIGWIIANVNTEFAKFIKEKPDEWKIVYTEANCVILVKT